MASLSPSRCAFCNEKLSTTLININTGKPSNDPLDDDTRYLCYYCICEQIENVKSFVFRIRNEGKNQLRTPFGTSPLIWRGDEFVARPSYYDRDAKAWNLFLAPGEHIVLALGGRRVRHKQKPDMSTPIFGADLEIKQDAMAEFDNNDKLGRKK